MVWVTLGRTRRTEVYFYRKKQNTARRLIAYIESVQVLLEHVEGRYPIVSKYFALTFVNPNQAKRSGKDWCMIPTRAI